MIICVKCSKELAYCESWKAVSAVYASPQKVVRPLCEECFVEIMREINPSGLFTELSKKYPEQKVKP